MVLTTHGRKFLMLEAGKKRPIEQELRRWVAYDNVTEEASAGPSALP